MSEEAANEAIKESRRTLRAIQDHITHAHLNLGAQQETIGLVNVYHHPEYTLPYLNYVAPRRNTAWIPGPQIESGLKRLRELGRDPRIYFLEGLYPPVFAKSLHKLGLVIESETALMTYPIDAENRPAMPGMPAEMVVEYPQDQQGIALWWYVWRNARFDVITQGTEPLYIGRDMRAVALGHQIDIILYRYSFPIAVARLTFHEQSAHLTAFALMKEVRTTANIILLHQIAIHKAAERGTSLLFTSGETEQDRDVARKIGFVDSGNIVCYSESAEAEQQEEADEEHVAEPILVLR